MKNKSNYELFLEQLSTISTTKKLLLHSCCAPCSTQVISYLTKFFDITILFYNPNIFPQEEYQKRKNEQIKLLNNIKHINELNFLDCDYDNNIYEALVKNYTQCPEKGKRCNICFKLRLEKTAQIAKENNNDYFSSTLSISPYKDSKLINLIGKELESKYNITWLYSDFKKENGYKKSIELSKKYNLYRQNYCGCKYSIKKDS